MLNGIDIVILVVLAGNLVAGLSRGFIVEVATILGALVALAVAKAEYVPVRRLLAQVAPHSSWLTVIAYLAVFLVVWGLIIALARVGRRLARLFLMGGFDRLGGAIIGLLQGAILVELLLYLGKRVPNNSLHRSIAHATLAPTFLHLVPFITRLFPHVTG